MNLLFMGDLHAADKPPHGRVDDYRDTVMKKLVAIANMADDLGSTAVISTGDIFHSKQSNRVSDTLRQYLIEVFKSFPCPVYVVPGNHDLGMAGLSSLSGQPLGTLEKAGAIEILTQAQMIGPANVFIVPRPYDTDAEGFHTGVTDPGYYSLTPDEQKFINYDEKTKGLPVIGVAHGSLLPPGDTRQYPYVDVSTIPGIEDYDLYVSGHIHEPLGVHRIESCGTRFANPGSVMRTARDTANYLRKVQVLCVYIDNGHMTITEVPIPGMRPALEVFGRKESTDGPEVSSDISTFVGLLGEGLRADEVNIPDLIAKLPGKIKPKVRAEVQRHLEEAQA